MLRATEGKKREMELRERSRQSTGTREGEREREFERRRREPNASPTQLRQRGSSAAALVSFCDRSSSYLFPHGPVFVFINLMETNAALG